jgi:DNA sulfur modification protein DndB
MSNKTFIPAFKCTVGDWNYYSCTMQYAEIARQVQFAYELGGNTELSQLVQRGLTDRTEGIKEYLLSSSHHFLGGLVVAVWGGEPNYTPLTMEDPDGMLSGLDQGFGVLTFDGTQQYFALDGQHRLRAIKDAIKKKPELGRDDICVLIVTHYDTKDGRTRTRRLFSNINRNAKQTGAAENIALDEDDGYAILTRRFLEDHDFLKQEGRVRVIMGTDDSGGIRLAGGSVAKTDARALTTFTVLYDILQPLGSDLPSALQNKAVRPSDDVLENAYTVLSSRMDDLMRHCGDVRSKLEAAASAKDVRAPKDNEGSGHPFMRPVVQKAVTRVASQIMQQGTLTWPELMPRLSALTWKMSAAPWTAVYSVEGSKMLTGKDNTVLLNALLHAHLAPATVQEIKRARKSYKDVRGQNYPISEEDLAEQVAKEGTAGETA